MSFVLIFLCVIVVAILCVLASRRRSGDGAYRRRFESRGFENRHRDESSTDAMPTTLWTLPVGIGDAGSHHYSPDAGAHCGTGSDGGASGCGDGGSS